MSCLVLAMWSLASASEPLSYEGAIRQALELNPVIVSAELGAAQSQEDVSAVLGIWDPVLAVNAGWNRTSSRDFFPGFPEPFFSDTDSWNAGMNLSATSPTGTSASFNGSLLSRVSTIRLDDTNTGALANFFGDDFEQRSFVPRFTFNLGQELLKGVLLSYNLQALKVSRMGLTIAQLSEERAKQQAIADTARSYWSWVQLAETERIAEDAVRIAEEDLRVGVARVEAGEAAPVERTRLQAALVQARSASIEAENAADQARDALLLLLGDTPGRDVAPATAPGDAPSLEIDADDAMAAAMEGSIDVRIARQQLELAELELARARHATWPTLTANFTAGLSGFDDESWGNAFSLNENLFPNYGVSGVFSVPLGNRAALSNKRGADLVVTQRKRELVDVEGRLAADVQQAVRLLSSAKVKIELADANLRLAEETLAAEQALFDAGRTLLKDVLESRTAVDRAEAEAIRARTDFRVAVVDLRRLQGQLGAK